MAEGNSHQASVENDQIEADLDLGSVADDDPLGSVGEDETVDIDVSNGAAEGTEYELCMEDNDQRCESDIARDKSPNEPCKSEDESEINHSEKVPEHVEQCGTQSSQSASDLEPEAEQDGNYLETGGENQNEAMETVATPNLLLTEQSGALPEQHTLPLDNEDTDGDNMNGKEDSSADLDVQISSNELEPHSDSVNAGSSPTLSLAEEDQTDTSTAACYNVDSENMTNCTEGRSEEEALLTNDHGTLTLNGGVRDDQVLEGSDCPSEQDPQPQESDDPECDLASSSSYRTADQVVTQVRVSEVEEVMISHSSNSSNSPSDTRAKQFRGPGHMKETLGLMLKQGIRSAAKDATPIREALGQLQQGLKSALTETTQFLDGTSVGEHSKAARVSPPQSASSIVAAEVQNAVLESGAGNKEKMEDGAGDASVLSDVPEDELLSQLDAELDDDEQATQKPNPQVNGVRKFDLNEIPEFKELKSKNEQLQSDLQYQKDQCTRLRSVNEAQDNALLKARQEADQYKKQVDEFKTKSSDEVFMAQIRALELTIAGQQKDLNQWKERLELHDKAAKEAVSKLQAEIKTKVDQLTTVADSCRKEKEDMVLKYAKAESKNIEMENKMAKNDAKVKEIAKERESMMNKFKNLKADQMKCRELFETRSTEVLHVRRELERCKEQLVSQEGKTKWAHNKLKAEMDFHKETKGKLEEAIRKSKVTRDEADQIRRDCQSMIKCYQESEEIKSNSLDLELKQKETELILHRQDKLDKEEVHGLIRRELDTLKQKHKEMLEELTTWRDKVKCLESERIVQEHNLDKYRETLQTQKETNGGLEKRLHELADIESTVIEVRSEITQIRKRNEELEQECNELRSDMEKCSSREQEHLEFTQKISDKNAHLQSENTALQNKVKGFSAEVERLSELSEDLRVKKQKLEKGLCSLKKQKQSTEEDMDAKLQEKTKEAERLTVEVDDMKNEIKTLKRKHAANTKDLMRQLQNCKRRLESLEPKEVASSMGSRTSSNGSLDTVNNANHQQRLGTINSQPVEPEPEPFVQVVEVDKQMLIEKIVRLQKAHARKNEKLEFLEDHIQQLFAEVQKKNKIIQNYALREESGTMAPEATDLNKALLAKKGGIMSSLYNAHQQDGAMTLDLSLDINRKLQAVLEDTLLKNITLKENLDTLGEEIARLSQENRQIKLQGRPEV